MLNYSVIDTSKMLFSQSQYLVKILEKSTLTVVSLLLGIFTPHLIVIFEIMP